MKQKYTFEAYIINCCLLTLGIYKQFLIVCFLDVKLK